MGYTGGTSQDPTYYNLNDHTETVELDFDPTQVSYEELVTAFFSFHDPTRSSSRQYMSAIFTHGDEQALVARAVLQRTQEGLRREIQTYIAPAERFYLAEDYHQKYALQGNKRVFGEFQAMYPDFWDIVDSSAASKVNAYLYGFGTADQLEAELGALGLSEEAKEKLRAAVPAGACPVL